MDLLLLTSGRGQSRLNHSIGTETETTDSIIIAFQMHHYNASDRRSLVVDESTIRFQRTSTLTEFLCFRVLFATKSARSSRGIAWIYQSK